MKAIFCIIIFFSSFCSIRTMIGMFGDNFEAETKMLLRGNFVGNDKTDPAFLASIRDIRKITGFQLVNIYVHSVWHGKYHFRGKKIPFNIYEVNLEWKNKKKDRVEYDCFMMSYANDIENDYLREMKYSDDCCRKDEWILKIKESINQ
ncbi:hypothetical protein [Photorhabdus viridis]|uniref:hypothetical protein n=1 Tax=Photorhabdus viridis TaxID=3163327 RepID=UPI0033071EE3